VLAGSSRYSEPEWAGQGLVSAAVPGQQLAEVVVRRVPAESEVSLPHSQVELHRARQVVRCISGNVRVCRQPRRPRGLVKCSTDS